MKALWILVGAMFLAGGVGGADESTLQLSRPETPKITLDFKDTTVTAILKSVAESAGLKVIISDDVRERYIRYLLLRDMTPADAIRDVCNAANLSYGRVGSDTFLIVPQRLKSIPSIAPVPQPRDPVNPLHPDNSETQPIPHWRKFEFNGAPYYLVPLK